jgi:hypothetical protein
MLPKSSSPSRARFRASGTFSRIQRILLPEKYASITRPVAASIAGPAAEAASSPQNFAVRRHCHTIAGETGCPVRRSHTTVVSR